jgi:hypothetical protein
MRRSSSARASREAEDSEESLDSEEFFGVVSLFVTDTRGTVAGAHNSEESSSETFSGTANRGGDGLSELFEDEVDVSVCPQERSFSSRLFPNDWLPSKEK